MSHDIEDIIAVFDGRPETLAEIKQSEPKLMQTLIQRFQILLNDNRFVDAIFGHMPGDATSQARAELVHKKMIELIEGG